MTWLKLPLIRRHAIRKAGIADVVDFVLISTDSWSSEMDAMAEWAFRPWMNW